MRSAILYSRVSTTKQADDGVSLAAQTARAHSWAAGMGYTVTGEYQDIQSGKRADNRNGLQAALSHVIRTGGALVVFSLSRLARSTKDALSIAEQLEKAGADLVSLSEQIDTTSAAGKMVFRMLAVLSEFERDLVSERTRAALSHKRASGYKTGGAVPYGFDVVEGGELVENETEQKAITLINSLRGKGYTLRAICAELKKQSITTKQGRHTWSPKMVSAILQRAA